MGSYYYYRVSSLSLILQRTLVGILAGLLVATVFGLGVYGLFTAVGIAKEILVALIAGAVTILSGIFAYIFQRNREIEMAAVQRDREMELEQYRNDAGLQMARRQQLQENYARILERLARYIRNPEGFGDDFATAHLYTWVVGSAEVVRQVGTFIERRDSATLDKILVAMRADLDLNNQELAGATTKSLFPRPSAVGELG